MTPVRARGPVIRPSSHLGQVLGHDFAASHLSLWGRDDLHGVAGEAALEPQPQGAA
jgi:hypothetical protein